MGATFNKRLAASPSKTTFTGTLTNSTGTATFSGTATTKQFVQQVIISAGGTITTARATLQWTYNGTTKTIAVQIGTPGVFVLNFGANPIEGDENTSIVLTVPALGAGGIAEGCLLGYETKT